MGAGMWYVLFLVPMGRGSNLEPLDPDEMEDVLHWLHDVSDRIAVKVTEAPNYRRVAIQRDDARAAGRPLPPTDELHAWLTAETDALLGEVLERRPPRPPIGVNSGRGFAFVDHIGDVYPSGFLPHRCGSVKERAFREIYAEAPMMKALRDPSSYSGKCGVCEFNWICGGSRARAHAMLGDPLGFATPPASTSPRVCVACTKRRRTRSPCTYRSMGSDPDGVSCPPGGRPMRLRLATP